MGNVRLLLMILRNEKRTEVRQWAFRLLSEQIRAKIKFLRTVR